MSFIRSRHVSRPGAVASLGSLATSISAGREAMMRATQTIPRPPLPRGASSLVSTARPGGLKAAITAGGAAAQRVSQSTSRASLTPTKPTRHKRRPMTTDPGAGAGGGGTSSSGGGGTSSSGGGSSGGGGGGVITTAPAPGPADSSWDDTELDELEPGTPEPGAEAAPAAATKKPLSTAAKVGIGAAALFLLAPSFFK